MRAQTVIQMSVQRLACTACGAEARASCNCGKPYVPAKQRAKDAIKANPQKSDRAIAADLGISHPTVSKARRETTGNELPVDEPRVGLDGKVRRLPVRLVEEPEPDVEPDIEAEIEPDSRRTAFVLRADQAAAFAAYSGPVDRQVCEMARRAAAAWQALANNLEQQLSQL